MSEEIKNILDKFDKVLENYELDKKCGQISTDSICHLFPSEIITIKDYIQQKENIIKEVREYIEEHIKYECDDAFNGMQFYSYHLYDFNKNKLLEILDKEVN